jgi:hypothetical protein
MGNMMKDELIEAFDRAAAEVRIALICGLWRHSAEPLSACERLAQEQPDLDWQVGVEELDRWVSSDWIPSHDEQFAAMESFGLISLPSEEKAVLALELGHRYSGYAIPMTPEIEAQFEAALATFEKWKADGEPRGFTWEEVKERTRVLAEIRRRPLLECLLPRETIELLGKRTLGWSAEQGFVAWAKGMLEAGAESRALRTLASLNPPFDPREIEDLLNRAATELRIKPVAGKAAVDRYLLDLAHRVLEEDDYEQTVATIAQVCVETNFPEDLKLWHKFHEQLEELRRGGRVDQWLDGTYDHEPDRVARFLAVRYLQNRLGLPRSG